VALAQVPAWVLDVALAEHSECCEPYRDGLRCGHEVYIEMLRDAAREARRLTQREDESREWRAKGFPR
jgi:hypothetical protein